MVLKGKIVKCDGKTITITAPFKDLAMLYNQQITECEVYLHDGRQLSPKQRTKIFALVGDISDFAMGIRLDSKRRKQWKQDMLCSLQLDYLIDICDREAVREKLIQNYCQLVNVDFFSLAARTADTVDMTVARDFIDWLVELCVVNGVPCSQSLLDRCEDIQRYLYACVVNRVCAVCGKRAEIHEWDRVGMGRDRRKIHHEGQRVEPLCRVHHKEVDDIGQETFDKKYHLTYTTLDARACEILGWKR